MGVQVTTLTKNKHPWEKEFIDFSFDGKYISEFGMVVVSDGDRHPFQGSPSFENETTKINGAVGQLFWGVKIDSLKRTYKLATDGMTEKQVNAFKHHFRPGKYGKFIEDKLMHRYSYCRIAEAVDFQVLPFRKTIRFLGKPLEINEYKGEITITFEWDKPYSYSTMNYIEDAEEITEEMYENAARAVYNNSVPLYSSWISKIYDIGSAILGKDILGVMILGSDSNIIRLKRCHLGQKMCLEFDGNQSNPMSELVLDEGHTQTDAKDPMLYYNPSNVMTPSILELSFTPSFTEVNTKNWQPIYYNNIADDINWQASNFLCNYNSIFLSPRLEGTLKTVTVNKKDTHYYAIYIPPVNAYTTSFHYTHPNVIYSINNAIKLAYDFYLNGSNNAVDLDEKLRGEIVHSKVGKWAISILAEIRANSTLCDVNDNFTGKTIKVPFKHILSTVSTYNANWVQYFNIRMLEFMYNKSNEEFYTYKIILNGQDSETKVIYSCNQPDGQIFVDWEESCGDIMMSPYFDLEGGDTVDEVGNITSCHALLFKQGGRVQNSPHVSLNYRYTYL